MSNLQVGQLALIKIAGDVFVGYVVSVNLDTVSVIPTVDTNDQNTESNVLILSELENYLKAKGSLQSLIEVKKEDVFFSTKQLCDIIHFPYLQRTKEIEHALQKLQHLIDLSSNSESTLEKMNRMRIKIEKLYATTIKKAVERGELSASLFSRKLADLRQMFVHRLHFKFYEANNDENDEGNVMNLGIRHVLEVMNQHKKWKKCGMLNHVVAFQHGHKLLQIILPGANEAEQDGTKFNESIMIGGDILFIVAREETVCAEATLHGICRYHQLKHSGRPFIPIILHHRSHSGAESSIYDHVVFSRKSGKLQQDALANTVDSALQMLASKYPLVPLLSANDLAVSRLKDHENNIIMRHRLYTAELLLQSRGLKSLLPAGWTVVKASDELYVKQTITARLPLYKKRSATEPGYEMQIEWPQNSPSVRAMQYTQIIGEDRGQTRKPRLFLPDPTALLVEADVRGWTSSIFEVTGLSTFGPRTIPLETWLVELQARLGIPLTQWITYVKSYERGLLIEAEDGPTLLRHSKNPNKMEDKVWFYQQIYSSVARLSTQYTRKILHQLLKLQDGIPEKEKERIVVKSFFGIFKCFTTLLRNSRGHR